LSSSLVVESKKSEFIIWSFLFVSFSFFFNWIDFRRISFSRERTRSWPSSFYSTVLNILLSLGADVGGLIDSCLLFFLCCGTNIQSWQIPLIINTKLLALFTLIKVPSCFSVQVSEYFPDLSMLNRSSN
jgi:hypothetical protein